MQDGALALGIDVGGTKIAVGVVRPEDGALLAHERIPAPKGATASESLRATAELAQKVAGAAGQGAQLARVGLGVPECVSLEGVVESAHTYAWTNRDIEAALSAIAPVTVVSDVQAAALAEATHGAGAGRPLCLYVSIGTGISHTMVIEGRPYRGATGNAILFGCTPVSTECPGCGATERRVLEARCAGPPLARSYSDASGTIVEGAEGVIAAAEAGDPIAQAILSAAGEEVGQAIGHLMNVFDPHVVVIGGGLGSGVTGLYWDHLQRAARDAVWGAAMKRIPIVQAAFGPKSGVIGAALAAVGPA